MAHRHNPRDPIDRPSTTPFLLRIFWRMNRPIESWEFCVNVPPHTSANSDLTDFLPATLQQQTMQLHTWPDCTLAELTDLFVSALRASVRPDLVPEVGTRLTFKSIYPDTRATADEGGPGRWAERPLGTVVIGGKDAEADDDDVDEDDISHNVTDGSFASNALKTLTESRFVVGDFVACSILPPSSDGKVAPAPPPVTGRSLSARESTYSAGPHRGSGPRANGSGRIDAWGDGSRYRNGHGGRTERLGVAPPPGDWRRGERLPGAYEPGGARRGNAHRGYERGRPF